MSRNADGVQVVGFDTGFTMVPHYLGRGGHGIHLTVLVAILGHGNCWASMATLAKEVGCSVSSIQRSILYWIERGPIYGVFLTKVSGKQKGTTSTISVRLAVSVSPKTSNGGSVPVTEGSVPVTEGSVPVTDKEESYKKNTIRIGTNNNAPDGAEASGVNQVFKVFYENGSPGIKYGNKTLRKDAQWLIDQFGLEETTRLAEVACNIQGKQYAPTIANPTQLREKLSSLQAFVARSISKDANRAPSFIEIM